MFFEASTPPELNNTELTLSEADSHHLKNVLRLSPGAQILLVHTGSAQEFQALVTTTHPEVRVKLTARAKHETVTGRVRSIAFAVMKGARNDLVVEKVTELGVQHIIIWQAHRSVARLSGTSETKEKMKRWSRIAEAAAKQSAKKYIPQVHIISEGISAVIDVARNVGSQNDTYLCCSLAEQACELRFINAPRGGVHIVVGPEGDFTPDEEAALVKHDYQLVSLGPFILRAETAAISATAMVQALWGNAP